jgi:outer membrane protein assembly factor BamB
MDVPVQRARLLALLIVVCTTVTAAGVVAGLSLRGSPGSGVPAALDGDGGTTAWTLDTKNGLRNAWVIADTAVVHDGESLLGLSAADGSPKWRLPYPDEDATFTVAGRMVAVQQAKDGPVDVVDPATGRIAWSTPGPARMITRQDALYLDSCPDRQQATGVCVTAKRRVTDGATLWSVKNPAFYLQEGMIGGRRPLAPAATAYLPVTVSTDRKLSGALLNTATGRLLPGRVEHQAWYLVAAGTTLVSTDHDPRRGDDDCTVTVDAVDGPTGKPAWQGAVYSGRRTDGECQKAFGAAHTGGPSLLGSGSTVAAVSRDGHPTLTDFATGKLRWRADAPGVPLAGDDRSLLVRDNAETGSIALLDLADGRRLWTAPDTGLPSSSASWEAAVAGDLVAVMGATGERPYVLVYDTRTGRQLARRGGWLTGIGDGWVMVSTGAGAKPGRLTLHMLTF